MKSASFTKEEIFTQMFLCYLDKSKFGKYGKIVIAIQDDRVTDILLERRVKPNEVAELVGE